MHDAEPKGTIAEKAPLSNGRPGIVLVMASEVMLFAGLVAGFVVLRFAGALPIDRRLPLDISFGGSMILLISSLALALLQVAPRREGGFAASPLLVISVFLTALGSVAIEGAGWLHLLDTGLAGHRGGICIVLMAAHLLHAIIGFILLALFLRGGLSRSLDRFSPSMLAVSTFYWHFVTLTWLAIVAVLALL